MEEGKFPITNGTKRQNMEEGYFQTIESCFISLLSKIVECDAHQSGHRGVKDE